MVLFNILLILQNVLETELIATKKGESRTSKIAAIFVQKILQLKDIKDNTNALGLNQLLLNTKNSLSLTTNTVIGIFGKNKNNLNQKDKELKEVYTDTPKANIE